MKFKLLLFVLSLLLFSQCGHDIDDKIGHIYKLSSPNKKIDIYECQFQEFSDPDSYYSEITLLNSTEKYNPRGRGNFHGYTILGWVGDDTLKVIEFHEKQEEEQLIPKSKLHQVNKHENFVLDISHMTSYGSDLDFFNFDSVTFSRDSVKFIQLDNLRRIKKTKGLLKGQVRISDLGDTITKVYGIYFDRIEKHFAKVTEGNKYGYPYVVYSSCEFTPNYRLKTSIFRNHSVIHRKNIKDFD